MTAEQAHRLARERGPSRVLYALVRAIVVPFMRVWFRLSIDGAEHIPDDGPAIVAPNHKSFFDSFFIAAATRRHVRYMGKAELFEGRRARLLVALGAFPVRRGQADAQALETARIVLEQGGLLSLFPEGTRVRDPDELGVPHRGAARLAIEAGAPLVPAAITGTEKLFAAGLPKPRKVRMAFAEPIPVESIEATPEAAGALVDERLWPEVETSFRGLRAHPGMVAAAVAALGIGAGAVARSQRPKAKGLARLPRPPALRRKRWRDRLPRR